MLGWNVKDGDLILFVPRTNLKDKYRMRIRELRIDHIRAGGRVKFMGKSGAMSDYIYDVHGILSVSDIITVKPFRHMFRLAQGFLQYTRAKLKALRANSLILKSLHFSEIKRLSRISASTKCLLHSAPDALQMTDATLIKCLTKTDATSSKNAQTN